MKSMPSKLLSLPLLAIALGWNTLSFASSPVDQLLRDQEITGLHAERIRCSFENVSERGITVEPLLERLREGGLKKAHPEALAIAVENRARSLLNAQSIIGSRPFPRRRNNAMEDLQIILARALEVGVPPSLFEGLFDAPSWGGGYRDQALIEAAEILFLSGTTTEDINQFIQAARSQQLRRMEILRAAHFWIERQAEGLAPSVIHDRLWEVPHTVPGHGGGNGRRMHRR